jgi:hypothetical protein
MFQGLLLFLLSNIWIRNRALDTKFGLTKIMFVLAMLASNSYKYSVVPKVRIVFVIFWRFMPKFYILLHNPSRIKIRTPQLYTYHKFLIYSNSETYDDMKMNFNTVSGSYIIRGKWCSDWIHFNGVRYTYQPFGAAADIEQDEYYNSLDFPADGVFGKYLQNNPTLFTSFRFKSLNSRSLRRWQRTTGIHR